MSKNNYYIIGQLNVEKHIIRSILLNHNINIKEVEFISYDEATNYNYKKLLEGKNTSYVIAGALPHKGKYIGNNTSIITMLEKSNNINIVRACSSNELKITKSSLINALNKLNIGGVTC